MNLKDKNIGFIFTGSFCTFSKTIEQLKKIVNEGANVIPIMSEHSYTMATRPPKEKLKEADQDALFLSERLERISNRTVQYIVKRELAKAGLDTRKYSVHKLRHTAATLMYQYGQVDIRALQELLGHESISTTQIYTHVENEQVRNAVKSNPLSDMSKKLNI